MTRHHIVALPGDGIGPEVTAAAITVCQAAVAESDHQLDFNTALIGGAALDATGSPLPEATVDACLAADAVLLGAVGGPTWDHCAAELRPERGLLEIRRRLGVFANLRPVRVAPSMAWASPVKADVVDGVDILFVRELTGGIYFGTKSRSENHASDECRYTVGEIERIVRSACTLATKRRGLVCSVDKANVLETSRLWRETAERIASEEFPEIELEHILVDAMAMYLMTRPRDFCVVVTENMFGDILTDEASVLAGSLGMLPSASLGTGRVGLYEPVHGSAPDLAGQDVANPCGAILSAAMMLRHSLGLEQAARTIERGVDTALERGVIPADLAEEGESASSSAVVEAILSAMGAPD